MKRRKWLWVVLALAGLVLLAALALPFVLDVDRYRGLIEQRAEQALGRDVRLGALKLSLLPFGVRVDDVGIGALPGEGGGELLTVEHLRVGARLLPLLGKRLEVTKIVVDGPTLNLERGADGRWNVERLLGEDAAGSGEGSGPPGSAEGPQILVESLRVRGGRIAIRDASFADPLELVLSDLDLSLRDVAIDRPLQLELSAALAGKGGDAGRIALAGTVGPLPEPGAALPTALSLRLERMPGSLVARVTEMLGIGAGVRDASLTLELAGSVPETFEARGTLKLDAAEVRLAAPDGTQRATTFDAELGYDVAARDGAALLEIRAVDLSVSNSKLHVAGSVRRTVAATEVDLAVGPSRVAASDLAAMLALMLGELPASFASPTPVEVALTARGPLGGATGPALAGKVVLADFTLRHPALSVPVEDVDAEVEFRGEHVQIGGLHAVVGSSDVSGSVTADGFAAPVVHFELSSQRADFGELLSLLAPPAAAEGGAAPAASRPATSAEGAEQAPPIRAEGTLSIARGTFETLDFSELQAGLRWQDDVLSLDPVSARLYDGAFRGSVVTDLGKADPTFELRGDAREIDLGAFLADNLGSANLLTGRFTGKVATSGTGVDFESIVRSLDGKGTIEVAAGRLGGLDVLDSLSKVSGLFGEKTVQQLSGRLASEGTGFDKLSGKLRLAGGALRFDELQLDSPDFRLGGAGRVDLLTSQLEGDFRLTLSQPISDSMRAEESKAGKLFWNAKTRRVELPFKLAGPYTEPGASIDFESMARGAVQAKAEEGARKLLAERLGVDLGGDEAEPAPAKAAAGGGGVESGAAAIAAPEWSGSLLARDLKLAGSVRVDGVKKAKLTVVDATGKEFYSDRVSEVDERLAAGKTGGRVNWRAKIDGDKLLLAAMPLTVRLVVQHQDGTTSQAELSVER